MKEAIQKAIEGGWLEPHAVTVYNTYVRIYKESHFYSLSFDEIREDPLFWQALGKSLGWEPKYNDRGNYYWGQYWHKFIDHLAERKPAEEFFTNLTTTH